ncbi:MAG TPA: VIT domain-containing protein [Isosphaeraceae bacterium]|jgi:Ca-activated chloride channel family protein|nr:VIT domain-containing protein [Isosphaeraceae bacterium]
MLSRTRRTSILALAVLAALGAIRPAAGQGIIIDRRPNMPLARTFEVREVAVDARVRDQVAEVRVSQTFHNPGSFPIDAEYLFPMPDEGAIQDFVLMVDGREQPGRLLPKDEARRIYEEIVRTKRDPALLEYMGRGAFRTSVFPIPGNSDRTVTLRYTQVLRRDKDVIEFAYPFGTQKFTAKPIRRLSLDVRIEGKDPIKSLYSPSHDATIRRDGDRRASISLVEHDVIPSRDFRLLYTLAEGSIGATLLSYRPSEGDDGYFLLLASPEVRRDDVKPRPKTVVCVLDRSGSMAGKKIEQARNALQFVLDNLRDDDLFNIIAYDDRVETFKPELQRLTKESHDDARRFVDNIRPGGSTDIDAALKSALDMLRDDSRPSYVLFLTDGLPTAGETRETAIADDGRKANKVRARVFAFGVGYDVNARLLDRLSGGSGGTSEYVKPDEDIEAHVSRFYAKLTSPVLTDIKVELARTDVNSTYPRDIPDLFEGGQLIWVGRYRQSGPTTVRLSGKVGDDRRSFDFSADLAPSGRGSNYEFVERLWAIRRVGFLIDQIDLHGQSRELVDELVRLSTRYGILTPYTSFLADENQNLNRPVQLSLQAGRELEQLQRAEGQVGVAQRAAKQSYMQADRLAESYAPAAAPVERFRSINGAQARGYAGRAGGGAGMMGGGMSGGYGAGARGAVPALAKDARGNDVAVGTVRHLGAKTFYRRANRWVDSTVTPDDEAKAVALVQFSDAYFRLARDQAADQNQYLTFDEPVTVKLAGKVYKIDPPK